MEVAAALYKLGGNSCLAGTLGSDTMGFAVVGSAKLGIEDGDVDQSRLRLRRGR